MSEKSQAERFAEAAAAVDADPDEVAFRAKLALIARQRPASEPEREAKSRTPKKAE